MLKCIISGLAWAMVSIGFFGGGFIVGLIMFGESPMIYVVGFGIMWISYLIRNLLIKYDI